MTTIHQRIKDRRQALGLSMEDLAKRVGVRSWQTVQQWENGSTAPSRKRLELVAEILLVSVPWLLYGDADGKKNVTSFSTKQKQDPDIAEVVRLMKATDASGRKLALGGVRAALAAHLPARKKGAAK